jgi:ABC-2 type transport system permease protein
MNFSRITALSGRIIRQIFRDRRTLVLIFIVPLVIMTLLYLVLTNTSSAHTLAIVSPSGPESDRINTLMTNLLPGKDKLNVVYIKADQVNDTLSKGNADAAIIFPPNFTEQVFSGQNPSVQFVLEGSDPNVASAMHDQIEALIHQLGVAISVLKAQQAQTGQGQGIPPALGGSLPFTVSEPQYLHGGPQYTFNDSIAPVFIGIFSFFFVFILTSIAFLRERSQGTIERVMASPMTRTELVLGYILGFTLFAFIQSLMILLFVIYALRVHYSGNLSLVFLVTLLLTIGSINLGIFLSAFAQNEFQIVQFIPLVFGVQIFLSGVFWPIDQLPAILRPISYILPLTYANEALRAVMLKGADLAEIAGELAALLIFMVLMIVLSALTMRRQIA